MHAHFSDIDLFLCILKLCFFEKKMYMNRLL